MYITREFEAPVEKDPPPETGWPLNFIFGVVKVFFLIIGLLALIVLIGFIFYRFSRKNTDVGFQDFLIDSVFHTKWKSNHSTNIETTPGNSINTTKKEEPLNIEVPPTIVPPPVVADPLIASYIPQNDPLGLHESAWDNGAKSLQDNNENDSLIIPNLISANWDISSLNAAIPDSTPTNNSEDEVLVPEWLKAPQIDTWTPDTTVTEQPIINEEGTSDTNSFIINPPETIPTTPDITVEETPSLPITSESPIIVNVPKIEDNEEESPEDVLLIREDSSTTDAEKVENIETPSIDENAEWNKDKIENIQISGESVIPETIVEKMPPPIEREANMPDWLSIDPLPSLSTEEEPVNNESPVVIDNEVLDSTQPTIIENETESTTNNTLPDWLIQSVKWWD